MRRKSSRFCGHAYRPLSRIREGLPILGGTAPYATAPATCAFGGFANGQYSDWLSFVAKSGALAAAPHRPRLPRKGRALIALQPPQLFSQFCVRSL